MRLQMPFYTQQSTAAAGNLTDCLKSARIYMADYPGTCVSIKQWLTAKNSVEQPADAVWAWTGGNVSEIHRFPSRPDPEPDQWSASAKEPQVSLPSTQTFKCLYRNRNGNKPSFWMFKGPLYSRDPYNVFKRKNTVHRKLVIINAMEVRSHPSSRPLAAPLILVTTIAPANALSVDQAPAQQEQVSRPRSLAHWPGRCDRILGWTSCHSRRMERTTQPLFSDLVNSLMELVENL